MPKIEPTLFDFVDQFHAEMASSGGFDAELDSSSVFRTFCESFFDQFFAANNHDIKGIGAKAKLQAILFVESLPTPASDATTSTIKILVVRFEEFCDLEKDSQGNYTDSGVTYGRALEYLQELLSAAADWSDSFGEAEADLTARIKAALAVIEESP